MTEYIRCGDNMVPIPACKVHSTGYMQNGTPINPDPKQSMYAHCIDCVAWTEKERKEWNIETQVSQVKGREQTRRRNKAQPVKRAKSLKVLEEGYLSRCEEIGDLAEWLMTLTLPSLLRLAKSIGVKGFGKTKDALIGEVLAKEGVCV